MLINKESPPIKKIREGVYLVVQIKRINPRFPCLKEPPHPGTDGRVGEGEGGKRRGQLNAHPDKGRCMLNTKSKDL
jgi:hypothetical protein